MRDVESLMAEVKELKCAYDRCRCETDKLGVLYETVLKEKAELEMRIRFLEGAVEAYKYCVSKGGDNNG